LWEFQNNDTEIFKRIKKKMIGKILYKKAKLAGECIPKTLSIFNIDPPLSFLSLSLSLSTIDRPGNWKPLSRLENS
jgi:hypothetical protein